MGQGYFSSLESREALVSTPGPSCGNLEDTAGNWSFTSILYETKEDICLYYSVTNAKVRMLAVNTPSSHICFAVWCLTF